MEKYDIDTKRNIGRGAFGGVYLYQRKDDRKEIVIKQIKMGDMNTEQRNGVKNEIDVSKVFKHPNIVRYLEYFIEDDTFMIVMEYVPGGNLFDYLNKRLAQRSYLDEDEIIRYFAQIARALHHIHTQKILHRDMKTHNILLDSTQKILKICDFGISKFLTQTNASTTVGTYHYMSPELLQSKPYNKKSDVWSLGCILYELITLTRAFDGSLQVILSKIIKCDILPMPEHYSNELKGLVKIILNTDPAKRPELTHILATPVVINHFLDLETFVGRIQPSLYNYRSNPKMPIKSKGSIGSARSNNSELTRLKSLSLEQSSTVYYWTSRDDSPEVLPICGDEYITQVCNGRTKRLGLSSKGRVFIWENMNSTIASIHFNDWRQTDSSFNNAGAWAPRVIGKFPGLSIAQVCCGDHFIAVRSVKGIVMTWGSGEHGCLGHGSTDEATEPKVVEELIPCTVTQISCGASHVMAVTNDLNVYAWGKGNAGNLGLNDKDERLKPTPIHFPCDFYPKSVICGSNYSFIITTNGGIHACGNNRENKLAVMTEKQLATLNCTPPKELSTFTQLACNLIADRNIVSIAAGPSHAAFLTEDGLVITSGSNKNGQRGQNVNTSEYKPTLLGVPKNEKVNHIGCGDTYTIGVTETNHIYCWGREKVGQTLNEAKKQPVEIGIDSDNLKYHSLSVCHNSTLLAAHVINKI